MTTTNKDPWIYMGPAEAKILGDVIYDKAEQARWCRAMLFGTLPYMWRDKATVVREMMFDKLALKSGDKVLLIGECVAECGFDDTIRSKIGPEGELVVVDITEKARGAYVTGIRGRKGELATWEWDYTKDYADGYFDCVAVIQAVQHTDDWTETATELLRVMESGRRLVLAEITFGPNMINAASLDIHIESWVEKIFSRMGWGIEQYPYYSPEALHTAIDPLVQDPEHFCWKGVELYWGSKP
jgi:ubiquinone/menaquinone biosynthesis C-methylase UbiE